MRLDSPSQTILTPRLRLGLGLTATGVGLVLLAARVLPTAIPSLIAGGIALGITGLALIVASGLEEP